MFRLGAERAHELGIAALKLGLPRISTEKSTHEFGDLQRFGLKFENPIGIAAGFDKNGWITGQLASLGFGFIEVGTVTLEPQPGNPKPRLFRLAEDRALINRLGFNNDGAEAVAARLGQVERTCVIGVNIGKNKNVPIDEATENYLKCFETIFPVADYVAVNISSPNTPSLRELQKPDHLDGLLSSLQAMNRSLSAGPAKGPKPLLVKVAPDLELAEIEMIVDVCMRNEVSGMIATNTTVSRAGLITPFAETIGGGLSGKPLKQRSTDVITAIYRYAKGKLPIVGVGGIFTAEDAFEKVVAGAALLQAYTGFIYRGPSFASDINHGLALILRERGFATLNDAIGSGVK